MVSWPHNTLIKFLKGFGRGPAQPINSLQAVKGRGAILVCFVVRNETVGGLHGNVTLDMVVVMDALPISCGELRRSECVPPQPGCKAVLQS